MSIFKTQAGQEVQVPDDVAERSLDETKVWLAQQGFVLFRHEWKDEYGRTFKQWMVHPQDDTPDPNWTPEGFTPEFSVQVRSETTGLQNVKTIAAALALADEDLTIWKISFDAGNGERVRLIRENGKFYYEDIMAGVMEAVQNANRL